jgi:hypothetical protein
MPRAIDVLAVNFGCDIPATISRTASPSARNAARRAGSVCWLASPREVPASAVPLSTSTLRRVARSPTWQWPPSCTVVVRTQPLPILTLWETWL